ncbi:hypothetical protein ACOMHN_011216 [Nucella lapillus]
METIKTVIPCDPLGDRDVLSPYPDKREILPRRRRYLSRVGGVGESRGFGDFEFDSEENALTFKWTSQTSKSSCFISYIASEDYPDNGFLEKFWKETGNQEFLGCTVRLQQLIETVGKDLYRKEQTATDREKEHQSDKNGQIDPAELHYETSSDDMECFVEDSQLSSFFHPMMKLDIDTFRCLLEPADGPRIRKEMSEDSSGSNQHKVVPLLCVRDLPEALEIIDCDIHVPLDDLDISPRVADIWGVKLDQPLVVRVRLAVDTYLTSPEPPKIYVFQPNQTETGIIRQLRNILRLFVDEIWMKVNRSFAQPQMSSGMPCDLSFAAGGDCDEDGTSLQALLRLREMGFGKTESCSALLQTDNNLEEASLLLCMSNKQPVKSCSKKDRKCPSADIKKMPSMDEGFLVMLYRYVRQRVPSVSDFCVICDNHHDFLASGPMLKPTVCSRELCLYSFETFGVMGDAVVDMATNADVVDLMITVAKAACFSPRKAIVFKPFPNIVDPDYPGFGRQRLALSEKTKDFKRVCALMKALPPMPDLLSSTPTGLQRSLDEKDRLLYPLLSWIINSNQSQIIKLPKDKQLKKMSTPHQFMLSNPPAQEKIFQAAKEKYGSCFAFHGSYIENWYSIIRQGLFAAPGNHSEKNEATPVYEVYLSPLLKVSAQYSVKNRKLLYAKQPLSDDDEPDGFLQDTNIVCLALCEVIKSGFLHQDKMEWCCRYKDHVCVRILFLFEKEQLAFLINRDDRISTSDPVTENMVRQVLEDCAVGVAPGEVSKADTTPAYWDPIQ